MMQNYMAFLEDHPIEVEYLESQESIRMFACYPRLLIKAFDQMPEEKRQTHIDHTNAYLRKLDSQIE